MSFDIPILFLVFNRPETTAQVFQRIKEIQPVKLFIAADGPRAGKEGEKEKCEAVRKLILDGINWDCDVKTLFRDSNLGCGKAVSGAITWFFENVEEGIILEDDTLPDLSFFTFCKTLLEKYRNDEKVKIISGNNFQNGRWRGDGSYYFSAYSHIWGWASWRRAWKEYDFMLSTLDEVTVSNILDNYFSDKEVKDHWFEVFQQLRAGRFDTWDLQLNYCILAKDGMTIVPNANLVINIGFGVNATHTGSINDTRSAIPLEKIVNIIHTTERSINVKADSYTFKKFYLVKEKGILTLISDKIKKLLSGNK
jgi:hypothetical protein